jgi:hypothetical protein
VFATFKTLHELFHVYADDEGLLRTEHTISFLGLTIIRLHYKISLARAREDTSAPIESLTSR